MPYAPKRWERQVSTMVDSDTCPRPTTGGQELRRRRRRPEQVLTGLASLGLDIGIFCDLLYRILLLSVILGLDFLGLALSRPQH